MRQFSEHINRWKSYLLGMLGTLALATTSCVNDSQLCPEPDEVGGDKIYLRFTIFTVSEGGTNDSSSTRAADIDGEIAGSEYENVINLGKDGNGLTYFLFDASQGFVADISPESTTVLTKVTIGEDHAYEFYEVVSKLDKDYINTTNTISTFYILAAANYSDWFESNSYSLPTPTVGQTISSYITGNSCFVMTKLPYTDQLRHQGDSWSYRPGGSYFPLAGLQRFDVQSAMIEGSTQNSPYDISLAANKDLNLLRTFAKIELIDKINVKDKYDPTVDGSYFGEPGNETDEGIENAHLRIHKLEMLGKMTQGTLFPNVAQWDRNGVFETQQVIYPTIPTTAEYLNAMVYSRDENDGSWSDNYTGNSDCITDGYPDWYATQLREDKCPVFSLYVYEYSRLASQLTGVQTNELPYLRVTLRGSSDTDTQSMMLPVSMEGYDSTTGEYTSDTYINYLNRNHIYRYEVVAISQDATLVWKLCDMDDLSTDIVFN